MNIMRELNEEHLYLGLKSHACGQASAYPEPGTPDEVAIKTVPGNYQASQELSEIFKVKYIFYEKILL